MLDPREVENKQFKATRLQAGYDQVEVDDFLDRVGSDYRYMFERVAELQAENSRLRAGDTQVIPQAAAPAPAATSAAMERLLQLAEEEAGKIKSSATWEMNKLRADAVIAVEKMKEEARDAAHTEHADIVKDAKVKKADLLTEISELDGQIAHLKQARDQYVASIRQALVVLEGGQ